MGGGGAGGQYFILNSIQYFENTAVFVKMAKDVNVGSIERVNVSFASIVSQVPKTVSILDFLIFLVPSLWNLATPSFKS